MPVTTTGSSNIASLDSKIVADLCQGKFFVDLTPSTWIGDGADNVLGANVQITNPAGVVVKPYGANYEIAPAISGGMEAAISFNIPTVASNYMYGKYTFSVQLFDAGGASWVVTKTLSLCEPDQNNKTRNYGTLGASLTANCETGKLAVVVNTPPTYKGTISDSQENTLALEYPTGSGLAILNTTFSSFVVQVFEGIYKLTGIVCALYDLGDNVFVKVKYKVKVEKNVMCIIDLCCVYEALAALHGQTLSACTDEEKNSVASTVVEALMLLRTAELAANCGEDPSEYIGQLEKLLGCKCTCNCNEGTPIINNTPAANPVSITGCNVSKSTVGLTDIYTIENYAYIIEIAPNGGALTVSSQTLSSCTKTQTITFDISKVYTQIKAQINSNAEYAAWASFINKVLNSVDVTCLGITVQAWAAMTFAERFQTIVNKFCVTTCNATISHVEALFTNNSITWNWTTSGANSIDIYLDGVLIANVLSSQTTYTYTGTITGTNHTYTLVPKCTNGNQGAIEAGEINSENTVFVAPPSVETTYLNGDCPYNLVTNLSALPFGNTAEWHTQNNTLPSTLVADPTNAVQGTYFVFAKDSDGNYSEGVMVQLVCNTSGSCTAPQNLTIVPVSGGNQVRFQSAAYPPPANSYTVKRRLASASDISANYTTIGTPVWNSSLNRWVINDTSAVSNVLYVYRAISNCGTTAPYIDENYASIVCPTVSFQAYASDIAYSFSHVGGEVDKYEVTIYEDAGFTAVHTDTIVPAFASPITGRFLYLEPRKDYWIRVKAFVGSFSKVCTKLYPVQTLNDEVIIVIDYIAGIFSAALSSPIATDLTISGTKAIGSNDNCATSFQEDVMASMSLPKGEVYVEKEQNGVTYESEKYHINNEVVINGVSKVNGDKITYDGQEITVQINHLACDYYPA